MNLSPQDFDFVRALVREANGNVIGDDKAYLLETRLHPLAVESGRGTLGAFLQHVRLSSDRVWRTRIAEALLITETYFFREPQTFEYLSGQILPELIERTSHRPLRLWSAACSSGQEVFSLALHLEERFGNAVAARAQITGSDVCSRVLDQARRAEFSAVELGRNLPERFRSRFSESGQDRWKLDVSRHGTVRFEVCNLTTDALPGPWDVVFLRNVLIYFDDATRQSIFRRIHAQLAPDGWLILGNSESYQPPASLFRRAAVGNPCFQKFSNDSRGPRG